MGTETTPRSPSGEVLPSPNPRRTHGRTGRATVTAGTLTPKGYAVDGVAADPAALDTDSDTTDSDAVENGRIVLFSSDYCKTADGLPYVMPNGAARLDLPGSIEGGTTLTYAEVEAEAVRQGRLRRWQAIR